MFVFTNDGRALVVVQLAEWSHPTPEDPQFDSFERIFVQCKLLKRQNWHFLSFHVVRVFPYDLNVSILHLNCLVPSHPVKEFFSYIFALGSLRSGISRRGTNTQHLTGADLLANAQVLLI